MMISPFSNASNLSKLSAGRLNPTRSAAVASPAQDTLRFSGNLELYRKNQHAAERKGRKIVSEPANRTERRFKEICDTIVLQDGKEKFDVADVIGYLCIKRPRSGYPGYQTIDEIWQSMPKMNKAVLTQAFAALTNLEKKAPFLVWDYKDQTFSLTDRGAALIEKLYPVGTIPEKQGRFTCQTSDNAYHEPFRPGYYDYHDPRESKI